MLRNYFTIAWRSLVNNKLYTIINTLGLTVGVSSCLVIYLIVSFELSFNKGIPDAERIYRIYTNFVGTYSETNSGVSTGLQHATKATFSGIENSVAFYTYEAKVSFKEDVEKVFENQNKIALVGDDYFDLVNYDWIEGSSKKSLSKPFQVVLTADKASLYFATTDYKEVLGKEVRYNDSLVVTVSGIVKSLPYQTDFDFTDFISQQTVERSFLKDDGMQPNDWESTSSRSQLFVKLNKNSSKSGLERQLTQIAEKNKTENKDASTHAYYKLQPLSDLHYNSSVGIFESSREAANRNTLGVLALVAFLLLIIASINFINLETAQAVKRAKEVGIRKVLGSSRLQIVLHFLIQSIILSFIAILLSLPLTELSLGFFSDFIPTGVLLNLSDPFTLLFLFGIVIVVGIFAGIYPAFFMSSFLPARAFRNQAYNSSAGSNTTYLRKGLVIFQFAFAQILIISTLVVIDQINFMTKKDLGFDKEAIIHFETPWFSDAAKIPILKGELENISGIDRISISSSSPSSHNTTSATFDYKDGSEEIKTKVFLKYCDESYIPLYGIKLIFGRNLLPSDSLNQALINETYLRELHLTPQKAIGKQIIKGAKTYTLVGVVKDFHTLSLHLGFQPLIICKKVNSMNHFNIKLSTGHKNKKPESIQTVMANIEAVWKKVYPETAFEYKFMDETLRQFYQTEQRMSKLTTTAMTIAIIICSLGLFGLVSYTSIQRTKEIGIRKVMGATVNNIVLLLSKDFLFLVIMAFVVAAPVAYYGADKFLSDYAFHTDIKWNLFALAGCASILLAFVTVSYQAIKAAISNPVDSLRSE